MKKQFLILLILLSVGTFANAQKEYRLSKSAGSLKLNFNSVIIEGYDGKEIIFSGKNVPTEEVDERAKGLVPISSSNIDNTGLGISVTENGQDVEVKTASKGPMGIITIKVPQQMKVSVINNGNNWVVFNTSTTGANSNSVQDELVLKNLKGEIEVSTNRNKIRLENNVGPMNIKTVYGSVEAIFNNEIKGPISIISVYDYVDVTMPASTKANIELGTNYGKLYAGKEFNIDIDKNANERIHTTISGFDTNTKAPSVITKSGTETLAATLGSGAYVTVEPSVATGYYFNRQGDKIKGTLNGGGINLILKSNYKNVYLRQK